MKLTFLGTGSAFTIEDNFHSNMLLDNEKGDRLLIDCGSDVRHSLHKVGLTYEDINDVYISHTHADHAGGLEWLGFTHKFDPKCTPPRLHINQTLATYLWNKTLSGGMRSIQEYPTTLSSYFDVNLISPDTNTFTWQGIIFEIVQVVHIYDYDKLIPCYGLCFSVNGRHIFITTDTQFTPERLEPYYRRADIIFHDCETTAVPSGVHPNLVDLQTLPAEYREKMWLYHYNPGPLPVITEQGFKGYVEPRQTFDLGDENTYKKGQ